MSESLLNGLSSPGVSWRQQTRNSAALKFKNKHSKTSTKVTAMHRTIMSNSNQVLTWTSMTCASNGEIHLLFLEASSSATLPVATWRYSSTEDLVSLPSSLAIHRNPSFLRALWNLSRKIKYKMRTARPIRPNQQPKSSLLRSKTWCWRATRPSST